MGIQSRGSPALLSQCPHTLSLCKAVALCGEGEQSSRTASLLWAAIGSSSQRHLIKAQQTDCLLAVIHWHVFRFSASRSVFILTEYLSQEAPGELVTWSFPCVIGEETMANYITVPHPSPHFGVKAHHSWSIFPAFWERCDRVTSFCCWWSLGLFPFFMVPLTFHRTVVLGHLCCYSRIHETGSCRKMGI